MKNKNSCSIDKKSSIVFIYTNNYMSKLWVLEKKPSSTSPYRNMDNFSKNSLSEILSTDKQAKHFVWLLRHGLTKANIEADARKEADEKLLDSERGPDSTIKKQARNFINFGIDNKKICIHFDAKVKRDRQTAKIFCEEIWLSFPDQEEMLDENVMKKKYPYLITTQAVATREKGSIDAKDVPLHWTEKNKAGAESILESRIRIFDYVTKLKGKIKDEKYKHHIMIGHRTGTNWFLDAKYNRSKIDVMGDMSESSTSQLDFGFLNDEGEFTNLQEKSYGKQGIIKIHDERKVFEFDLQNYQQQVEEFVVVIPKMNILSGNDIISDTNIINEYLEQIKKDISEGNTPEQVEYYLKNKSEIVRDYVLSFVVDIIASQKNQQKELEWVVIDHLKSHIISEEKKCRLFAKLYVGNNELWRYLLKGMYDENKSITANPIISTIIEEERKKLPLGPDGRLIEETKIEQEIEKFDSIKEYENIHINTLLWDDIPLKDFYVQQNLTIDGETISSDDLVKEILTSDKKIFAIQAAGGSWKTMLSKYLLTQCANTDMLQKNAALSTWVKEIDINKYTSQNINTILQWPENILVIDALDEKNPDAVKSLADLSNSYECKNSGKKIVVLGRYIEDGLLYKDEKKNKIKENSISLELAQEVDPKKYIESFSKILGPNLQEVFKKGLSDILSKVNRDLHTPIIIEMLANIVKRKLTSWRGNKVFVDEQGNEKTDITRKDIYDRFFRHLHEREDQKSDKIWVQNERLYENNPFMWEKYDELRKEFLTYLSMTNKWLWTQRARSSAYTGEWWQLEFWDDAFQDIFRGFMLYKSDNKEEQIVSDFVIDPKEGKTFDQHLHNIELFKETLLGTNILKKDQNGKLSFHHKTFEEYFGYLYFEKCTKEEWIDYIQKIISPNCVDNSIYMLIQTTAFKDIKNFKKTLEWYAQYWLYNKYNKLTDSILKICDTIEWPIDISKEALKWIMSWFHTRGYYEENINKFMWSDENKFNELLLKNWWFYPVIDKIEQKKLTNGQVMQRLDELLHDEGWTFLVFRNLDRLLWYGWYDEFIASRAITTYGGCKLLFENLHKFKNLDRERYYRKIVIMTTKFAKSLLELFHLYNKETRDILTWWDINTYKIMIKNLTQTDFWCEFLLRHIKRFTWLNNKYIISELMKTKIWISKISENRNRFKSSGWIDVFVWFQKEDYQRIFDSLIIKWPEYYFYLYSLRDDVIWKIWLNDDSIKKLMETGIWCSVLVWSINTLKNINSQDYRYILKKIIESGTWYWIREIFKNKDILDFLDKDDHKNLAEKLLKWTSYDVQILLSNISKMKIDQTIYTKKANERIEMIKEEKAEQQIKNINNE